MRMRVVTRFNHIKTVRSNLSKAVDKSISKWADDGITVWQDLMLTSPPTGRTYNYDPSGQDRYVPHVASAPGNPPRIWTGEYADSIRKWHLGIKRYAVGSDLPRSADLEFGTSDIEPRPVAGPTAVIISKDVAGYFSDLEKDLF